MAQKSAPAVEVDALEVDALPAVAQDYLKAIFRLAEWDHEPVTAARIAGELGLKPSTTTEGLKRLESQGLISREAYKPVELTNAGRVAAMAMVRRHRMIETFLVETLGYGWDEIHDEAERIEHAVSETFVERLAAHLGNPQRDPHGDPIPDRTGHITAASVRSLVDLAEGEDSVVERISDKDPELLRYLEANGIVPGAVIIALERPYPSMLTVGVGGSQVPVSAESACLVRVRRAHG